MIWRTSAVAIFAGIAWFLSDSVANRSFAENSPYHVLYWLHDHVFLPVKGYTYTYHHPLSLVWWGLIVTMLGLKLISFLTGKSAVRRLHLRLTRCAVRQKHLHPILVTTARWLHSRGLEPGVLKVVVEHERALAMNRLVASTPARARQAVCARVECLTSVLVRLRLLTSSRPANANNHRHIDALLDAAALWHQALLQIRVHGNSQARWYSELLRRLAREMYGIATMTPSLQGGDQLEGALGQPAGFDPVTVMVDLLHLASVDDHGAAERLGIIEESDRDKLQLVCCRLAESVEGRRSVLDEVRGRIETLALHSHPTPAKVDIEDIVKKIPSENPLAIGQLSLGIALHLAGLIEDPEVPCPEIAWGYIDSVDALAFTLGLVERSPPVERLCALIGDIRFPQHYDQCARLAESNLSKRKEEWKRSPLPREEAEGSALTLARIDSLHHAAGLEALASPSRRGWLQNLNKQGDDHHPRIGKLWVAISIICSILLAGIACSVMLNEGDIVALAREFMRLIK